jgi:hypothetical protein
MKQNIVYLRGNTNIFNITLLIFEYAYFFNNVLLCYGESYNFSFFLFRRKSETSVEERFVSAGQHGLGNLTHNFGSGSLFQESGS